MPDSLPSNQTACAEVREADRSVAGAPAEQSKAPLEPPNSSFKPTLLLIAGRMLAFVVTFFIPIVLTRVFDQKEFGTYKQVFLVFGTLFGVVQIGMAESLYYFIPHNQEHGGRLVLNAMLALTLSGLASLALLYFAPGLVAGALANAELSRYTALLGVYLLLSLVTAVLEISMISRNRYRQAACTYAASDLARTLFLVVPALVFHSLYALLMGGVAFGAMRLAALFWFLHREFPGEMRFDWPLLRRQLAYAMPFELAVIVDIAQSNFHSYAVSHYFSPVVFAIYSVGCLQLPFLDFVANPACNVMMVRMGEQIRAGRRHAVALLWHDTTRKLALIFVPMFVLLAISARQIISFLFPAQYLDAAPIFMLWSTVVLLSVFQTDGLMRVYARTGLLVFLNAVRLTVIVALIWWCLRVFGLRGAVAVTLLGTVVSKSIAMARAARLMGVRFRNVLPWRSLAAVCAVAAAAAVPAILIRDYFPAPVAVGGHFSLFKLAMLAAMGSAYSVAYVGMLFGFQLLEPGERQVINAWLRRGRTQTLAVEGGSQ